VTALYQDVRGGNIIPVSLEKPFNVGIQLDLSKLWPICINTNSQKCGWRPGFSINKVKVITSPPFKKPGQGPKFDFDGLDSCSAVWARSRARSKAVCVLGGLGMGFIYCRARRHPCGLDPCSPQYHRNPRHVITPFKHAVAWSP
jgi:hypothetical protein